MISAFQPTAFFPHHTRRRNTTLDRNDDMKLAKTASTSRRYGAHLVPSHYERPDGRGYRNGQPAKSEQHSSPSESIPLEITIRKRTFDEFDGQFENGYSDASDEVAAPWFLERACVRVKNSNTNGVIKSVNGVRAVVALGDGGAGNDAGNLRIMRCSEVAASPPREHDEVIVTGGEHVGVEGKLLCVDGTDAILMDNNEDFKIVDLANLAKIATGKAS